MPRLLLAGSNSVHTFNYLKLIEGFFDEVLLITTSPVNNYKGACSYFNFSLKNPFSAYKTVKEVRKKIVEFKPDVIHLQQANSVAYLTLKAAGHLQVPKVLTAWGSDILLTPSMGFLYKQMVLWNLKHADYFTADAAFVAEKMKSYSSRAIDVSVINFGIDTQFPILAKENIIYSNRLHKKLYRVDKIIRAFSKLPESNKAEGWKLVIAAEGEERGVLQAMVKQMGLDRKVEFIGWVDKDRNLEMYAKAKIFVSVPESDATSVSLLEAMAAGCLPVVSNLPANREWIANGENGIIVDDVNSSFLEPAIKMDIAKAAVLNKDIIEQRATKKVAREGFIKVYKQALKNG